MKPSFYLLIGDKPEGPFHRWQLEKMLTEGDLDAAVLAAEDGGKAWTPVQQLINDSRRLPMVPRRRRLVAPFVVASIFSVVALVVYVYVSPGFVLKKMQSAARMRDTERLSECIDFPALRQNLKEQFNVAYLRSVASKEASSSEWEQAGTAIGAMLGTAIIDRFIENFVSPAGLAAVFERNGTTSDPPPKLRFSFQGLSRCSAMADEVELVLLRDGITWKLINIKMPLEKVFEENASQFLN